MASKDYLKGEGKYIPYYPYLKKVPPRVGFQVNSKLLTKKNFDSVMELARTSQATSFDVETTGLQFADQETRLITINLGFPGNLNYVAFYYGAYFPKEKQELLPTNQEIDKLVHLVLSAPRVYAHNRFFDQRVLMHKRGFIEDDFFHVHDTLSLIWLMDTNVKDGLGLKRLAVDYLGLPEYHFDESWEGEGILMANPADLVKYGGLDAYCTLELGEMFYRIYREHMPTMWRIELEFNNAIFNWEEQERVIDGPYLEKLQEKCDAIVEETKEEYYSKYGIINLGSNEEKSDALFALGYSTGKMNKGTSKRPQIQSVATKELEKLVKEQNCDPARLMIKFAKYHNLSSKLKKLVEAYQAGMPSRFHVFPNRVPSLRLASGTYNIDKKPYWYFLPVNSQALTKSPAVYKRVNVNFDTWDITFGDDQPYLVETQDDSFNLRSFLVPHDEDSILVRCDFKSEEIRIISNIAQIDPLVEAINNGRDPHKYVASKMYGVPYDEVTPLQRKKAKEISLGTGYGASEYTVSNKLGIPIDDARDAFARYKAEIPQLFQWQEKVKQEATFTGEAKLSFGWSLKLRFWVKSRNPKVRDYGYRRGWNQIQCYAGFCLRLAHIKLFNLIWKKPKPEEIGKMSASGCTVGKWYGKGLHAVLSLHDEVVLSVPKKYATEFIEDLYYLLKSTTLPGWKVPLIADIEVATRYGAVVPLSVEELPDHHLKFAVAAEKEKVETEEPEEEIIDEEDGTEEFGGISF